jgi:hypothetical protein
MSKLGSAFLILMLTAPFASHASVWVDAQPAKQPLLCNLSLAVSIFAIPGEEPLVAADVTCHMLDEDSNANAQIKGVVLCPLAAAATFGACVRSVGRFKSNAIVRNTFDRPNLHLTVQVDRSCRTLPAQCGWQQFRLDAMQRWTKIRGPCPQHMFLNSSWTKTVVWYCDLYQPPSRRPAPDR